MVSPSPPSGRSRSGRPSSSVPFITGFLRSLWTVTAFFNGFTFTTLWTFTLWAAFIIGSLLIGFPLRSLWTYTGFIIVSLRHIWKLTSFLVGSLGASTVSPSGDHGVICIPVSWNHFIYRSW